ncbi:hypothetical protein [Kutzneria sp. CA-103260]|uniref:hypothetical protein n=1 Tax=Kutzneria sp. CA-103260 TaxID=2802641 RepID=UPI001BA95D1F|nr:hypothetical protein [Kutzneria sp. CA-103260]QUQ70247.1 hypothetical protein JJ691_80220 [Kutzneria sp. CA-103260]
MDENKLADKFRDAVGDVPPPSFDTQDVLVASKRATARARKRLQSGVGVALGVVLIGGVLVLTRPFGDSANTMSSAGGAAASNATSPMAAGPNDTAQSGPNGGKMAPNHTEEGNAANCGGPDQGLAAALVAELPSATGVETMAADVNCPAGAAAVMFQLTDGSNAGKVELVLVPASVPNDPSTGAKPAVGVGKGNSVTVKTRGGGALTLASLPMNGSTSGPYAGQLTDIAARLAARY